MLHSCQWRAASKRSINIVVMAIGITATIDPANAQHVPESISFQGFVTNPGGDPMNSTVNITTTFYKNGVAGYAQVHPSVQIVDGIFHLNIGPVDTVLFDQPIDLGIKLGADPEISPRTPLRSAPFALGMRGLRAIWADDGDDESYNLVGGSPANIVGADVVGATIGGGGSDALPNSVLGEFGTVAGGEGNAAGASHATVGGGLTNSATGSRSTVAGGLSNTASGDDATVGGGFSNTAADVGTVSGGSNNTAGTLASVSGGTSNDASGPGSSIGGGAGNRAMGTASTVPGGEANRSAGQTSFASGYRAKAVHAGTFVWNDRSITTGNDSLVSTGNNQFLIRAAGGFGIGTNAPDREATIFDGDNDGDAFLNLKASNASARELLLGVNQSTGGIISMETNNNLQFRTNGTARMTIDADGEVGIGTLSPDGLLDVNDVFKVQTHNTGAENQNARLFFSESNNNKLNGYSLIYAGDSPQTFDGTAFALAANELHFVRHDNLAAGNVVMSMSRTTGDIIMANDLTVSGDLNVTGTKNFKIDHPLDPENRFLVHYALESDEVLNVYSGNVVTDAGGMARVELPAWFEALNKDFRYQLTVLRSFARATVAEEIADNGFTIQTDEPQVKVSWQVSAVRDDPAARNRQPVEQVKTRPTQ